MTRPCKYGLAMRPRRLFGFSAEPVDEAPCFFTGSITPKGCGLPSTDSLAGLVLAGKGKIEGRTASTRLVLILMEIVFGPCPFPAGHASKDGICIGSVNRSSSQQLSHPNRLACRFLLQHYL